MIIIDLTVAAFSAVTSNPIKHKQHRAMTEPFCAEEVEAVDLGTRYRIADRFVVHRIPTVCVVACP